MNEVSKILNYFKKIELVKTKNVLSIKPVNLVENWENFNNDLHELFRNYPNDKLNSIYETFNTTKNIQTKHFKHLLDCKKKLIENKYNEKSVTDIMPFVIEQYPFETNVNIVNWQLYKGAIIKELFINEFIKLMRLRLNYIEIATKFIEDAIKESEPNYKDVETSANNPKVKVKEKTSEKNYSQKQVAIAYYILGIKLTEENYLNILIKHTKTKSKKILQKLITKNNQLTTLSNIKTTDTKHLEDLNKAKRLLSGINKINEIKLLNAHISAFESNYKNKY